jgi:hypothetical protein
MSSAVTTEGPARGSTRIRAQIPVRVVSLDPTVQFSERCHTLVVNIEGCGVRISQPLEPGLQVLLDELPAGNSARGSVANCVPLGHEGKYWVVGIALEKHENIWCIQPAPPDWGESKPAVATVHPPQKSDEWPYSFCSSKGEAHPGRR